MGVACFGRVHPVVLSQLLDNDHGRINFSASAPLRRPTGTCFQSLPAVNFSFVNDARPPAGERFLSPL